MSTTQTPPQKVTMTLPQEAPPAPSVVIVQPKGNGLGTTGFVLGVIGAIFGLIPLLFWIAFPLGGLGLIFGSVGWRHAVKEPERGGKGLAIAGTILSVIAIALAVVGATIINNALS